MPLTDIAIRKVQPTEKVQRLADGAGLYLEVSPSGGKWWRMKYRYAGKEKRLSLGTYPSTSLKEARARRDQARKLLAAGTDPSVARQQAKAAQRQMATHTLEAVTQAWLSHRANAWTESTRTAIAASLESHVFPTLGSRPLSLIQPGDIRTIVQTIEASGASETAVRVFQRLRAICRYAVAHELIETDPTYPLKPAEILKPRKVQHRAALSESDVPQFLRKLANYQGDPTTKAALELLMLTATRPGELRGARWSEFNEVQALWRIPRERMKMKVEHTVPFPNRPAKCWKESGP
jgi:hypothetical protein